MNLPKFSVKYPVTVTMIVAAIIIWGVISLERLGTDLLPDINSPRIVVTVASRNKSPQEMEERFAERLEGQISTIPGVRRVSSVARVGKLIVTVEFGWQSDMDFALLDVQKKAGPLEGETEVDDITVTRFDPRTLPVMTIGVLPKASQDLDELRRIAKNSVKRPLERLEGVASAIISGEREKEVVIRLDEHRLEAYGVTPDEIRARVLSANVNASGGKIEDNNKVYIIKGVGEFEGIEDVKKVTVGYHTPDTDPLSLTAGSARLVPIILEDVADVEYTYKDAYSSVRINGKQGVGISIYKRAGGNTVRVSNSVREALDDIRLRHPSVAFDIAGDQSSFIRSAIGEVKSSALIGMVLAVLVLYAFLRNFRSTFIMAVAIPISIIATFNLMYFAGLTLNVMTLGGLALGAGMLVDNAIVVVENIFRHRKLGKSRIDASIEAASEVGPAILAATLTTIVVFLPIVFVHGVAGELFKEQAMTVAFSLLSSLVVALLFIPMLTSRFLPAKQKQVDEEHATLQVGWFRPLLAMALRMRFMVIMGALLAAFLSVLAIPYIGNEFIPHADQGQFVVKLRMSEGTRLEVTEKAVDHVERVLKKAVDPVDQLPLVETVFSMIGVEDREEILGMSDEDTGPNTASMVVTMRPAEERTVSSQALAKAIDPFINHLGRVSYVMQQTSLEQTIGTSSAPIGIEIKGSHLDTLKSIADRVVNELEDMPELEDIKSSFQGGRPEVVVDLDRTTASAFGLDVSSVAGAVRKQLEGDVFSSFQAIDDDRDIEMSYDDVALDELPDLDIENPLGSQLKLGDIAKLRIEEGAREIRRADQTRMALVTANLAPNVKLSAAAAMLRERLADFPIPTRYRMDVTGEEKQRTESFRNLQFALILAIVLIYMVLASLFESLLHPFTIMLTVPMAGIGVVVMFLLVGEPFSVMGFIGIIMLAGIAVNDAIVFIDFINTLRKRGMDRHEAILTAGQTRLRPILMTSMTTILALLPLSIGLGEGAELRAPMALAVIGGLVTSTLLTLFVIPTVYTCFDDIQNRILGKRREV
ncbi:efflux RND transporter permease subunit [Candidatus Hydrogenedentota bacterium]